MSKKDESVELALRALAELVSDIDEAKATINVSVEKAHRVIEALSEYFDITIYKKDEE